MKKLLISLALLSLTSFVFSQEKGIDFVNGLSWKQIQAKAKVENKFIFMDVFATWCGPCKLMDENTYATEQVGSFMNDKFISVKLQADKTNADNEEIKSWYADADRIIKEHSVSVYPTYLFFTPDGKLVHRGSGFTDTNGFIAIASAALDPSRQYYSQVEKYKQGKLNPDGIKELSLAAKSLGEEKMAQKLADDYINNYLLKLKDSALFTKENLMYMAGFLGSADSKAFKLFMKQPDKVNNILGYYQAQYAVMKFISKENIPSQETWKVTKPDWDNIEKKVIMQYGALGQELMLGQKVFYYLMIEDWQNYGTYCMKYFEIAYRHPLYNVNSICWSVFEHVTDPKVLAFVCDVVMKYAIEEWYLNDPECWDTYANLLHKTGKTQKAIEWEERALKMKKGQHDEKLYSDALAKMKAGQPT